MAIIDPFNDLTGGEDREAVKAATKATALQFAAMLRAVLVGENVILAHSAS